MNELKNYKSRTPIKPLLKENSDGMLDKFKLDKKNNSLKDLYENQTEKKLQNMKFNFYVRNKIESESVGNSNFGVYKKINSPLISENLKSKFSKVFKETVEKRENPVFNFENKGNTLLK